MTSTCIEVRDEVYHWLNKKGELHREDGPAIETHDFYSYHINGEYHRIGGPAIKDEDGGKYYYIHGKLHRLDGPAIDTPYRTEYWINGVQCTKEQFDELIFCLLTHSIALQPLFAPLIFCI